ncbi:AAA family ATPase [Ihubacter sp. rT4E-8]
MLYLEAFTLPGIDAEERILNDIRETYYVSFYPFGLFPTKELDRISFDPVTIFYGGNGSGKTTLINVIAEKLRASRSAPYNKSSFFDTFVEQCTLQWEWQTSWQDATVITSDDVFEYIFDLRAMNEGVDNEREKLAKEYLNLKNSRFRLQSLADYEQLKKVNAARRGTKSNFIRSTLVGNAAERSNGESAFMYFTHKIEANQIYLLDEPENSLSAEYQQELCGFLEDSARFYNCQFIIATHSPFLLAVRNARIYDLDSRPVCTRRWTELSNVRRYYDFFKAHEDEF